MFVKFAIALVVLCCVGLFTPVGCGEPDRKRFRRVVDAAFVALDSRQGAGLLNLGNTCFMNSVLQAIFGVSDLLQFLKAAKSTPLTNAFLELCKQLAESKTSVDPSMFRNAFVEQFSFFNSNDQQDAFEFASILLDALHEETKTVAPSSIASFKLTSLSAGELQRKANAARGHSLVADSFQGTLLIETTGACGCVSGKFEPFVGLAVPVVTDKGELITNLADAISEFERPQLLTGADRWECGACSNRVNAKTRTGIFRVADVLMINLKRFRYTPTRGLEKLTHMVDYPMTLEIADKHFRLCAVVLHSGTATFGHYIALVAKQNGPWRSFNDRVVTDTANVLSKDAYILFYKRNKCSS